MSDPSLASARNDEDVIAVLAKASWYKHGRDGDPEIPTLEQLGEWWRSEECPEAVRIQAEDRFRRLMDWCDRDAGRPPKPQLILFEPGMPTLLDSGQPYEITKKWRYAKDRKCKDRKCECRFNGGHPLGGVLVAWHGRRVPIPANTRDDPLFPPLGLSRREQEALALVSMQAQVGEVLTLPGFGPGEPDGPPDSTPAYPLLLWDLASQSVSHTRSRHAAWLAARIFVDVILDVAPEHWAVSASHGVRLPAQRFRDFLARVYLRGKSGRISWKRTTQLDNMLAAFDLLESREMRIPWTDSAKEVGGLRRVLVPLDIPRSGHADDVVQFAVHLPTGITEGPLLDRPFLRRAGAKSIPAWRLWLNLSDRWRIPGRTRIPAGRTWLQARDPRRYPVVSDAELRAWAFPTPDGESLKRAIQRKHLHRAKAAVKWMEDQGVVEVVSSSDGRRVIPGPKWAGWGGGGRRG